MTRQAMQTAVHTHPRNQEWIAQWQCEYARQRGLHYLKTGRPNMARDRWREAKEHLQESISLRKRSALREHILEAAE